MVANCARRIGSDRPVVGAARFRGHDWPWHLVGGAHVARCVCGARDLSGLYLILQAIFSFGLGGYLAGRVRASAGGGAMSVEEAEMADGVHGLGVWALAVVMGAVLATLIAAATVSRTSSARSVLQASAAEPLLSYEIDRLFRAGRRAPNVDLSAERAEAGRILLTTSSHSGLTSGRSRVSNSAGRRTHGSIAGSF